MSQNTTAIEASRDGKATLNVIAYSQIPEPNDYSTVTENELDKPWMLSNERDDGSVARGPYFVLID